MQFRHSRRWFAGLVSVLAMLVFLGARPAVAEEVTLDHKGTTLLGTLTLADGKAMADGVLLVLHGTLAHKDMEITTMLRDAMADREISTLTISLSLGQSNRTGMYDCAVPHTHRHMDAVDEVAAWVDWLKAKGAGDIWVAGHSRGGNQIVHYGAGNPDPAVKKIISIAPNADDSGPGKPRDFEKNSKKDFKQLVAEAEKLVAEDKGDTMFKGVGLIYCPGSDATASSFAGYYGKGIELNTAKVAKGLKRPTLFIAGSEDTTNPDVAAAIEPMADGEKISVLEIEGAGHFFRDLFGEDVADAIADFISGN